MFLPVLRLGGSSNLYSYHALNHEIYGFVGSNVVNGQKGAHIRLTKSLLTGRRSRYITVEDSSRMAELVKIYPVCALPGSRTYKLSRRAFGLVKNNKSSA